VASKNRIIHLFHEAGFTKVDTQIEDQYGKTKLAAQNKSLLSAEV